MSEKAIKSIEILNESLNNVGNCIENLSDKNYSAVEQQLSKLESTKLNVALAYSLASLYYILLKTKVK